MKKGKASAIVGFLIITFLIASRLLLDERYVDGTVIGWDKLSKGFSWFEELFDKSNSSVSMEGVNGSFHFLDVGQGDSTYIKIGNWDILVDAGPKSEKEKLLEQLRTFNIDDFELVIATHPHEDHIGGFVDIFNNYDIEAFYMPKVNHNTKTFEDLIMAVRNEGLQINTIKEGLKLNLGPNGTLTAYSPIGDSTNLNNYSPILKFTIGDINAILTGDSEKEVEKEVALKYTSDLKADIYKFGHHGSKTSSSKDLLDFVNPTYGVISCGVDNKYGHPDKEVLKEAKKRGVEVYRTDIDGMVSFEIQGNTIREIKTN